MSRAAILFASATAVAACGGKEDTISKFEEGTSSSSGNSSNGGQMYGPAPIDAGPRDNKLDSGVITKDAGEDGGPTDAGKREGGAVALYGPSPIDGG